MVDVAAAAGQHGATAGELGSGNLNLIADQKMLKDTR